MQKLIVIIFFIFYLSSCKVITELNIYRPIIDIVLTTCIAFFTGITWYFSRKSSIINSRPIIILSHNISEDKESKIEYEDYEMCNLGDGPALNIKIIQKKLSGEIETEFGFRFHLRSSEKKRYLFRRPYNKSESIFDKEYVLFYNDLYKNTYRTIVRQSNNSFKRIHWRKAL